MKKHFFDIAEHKISVSFVGETANDIFLLPSYEPFKIKETDEDCMLSLTVDDSLKPINKELRERIDIFDTGNGKTIVDSVKGGGYQFIVKDINGDSCCLLQTNSDYSIGNCALNGTRLMRSFGLNTAIMMLYAFRGVELGTLLIHASLVRNNGYGYAFTAKSGTGKSTHTNLWIQNIEGSDLMNDDNPIIRVIDNKFYVYGSPWSGKTPCYRNIKAPLGAIVKIERAKRNRMEKVSYATAFGIIVPACSTMKWDKGVFGKTCDLVIKLLELTPPVYKLHCLPNAEAARLCYDTIAIKPTDNDSNQ